MIVDEEMIALARSAAENAYAPFSRFRVGAVAVAADGTPYSGANVENSAFGATICAEANAISSAAAAGARRLAAVAVSGIDADERAYPCGNCRQLMKEFGVERVIVDGPDGSAVHTLEELLPYGFRLDPPEAGR
jgi:cytidine deaminase